MNEELRAQLEAYHEADEYEQIVETIEGIPAEDRGYELVSHLGRALNNLERYEEAAAQFLTVAEEGRDDPLWHYRIGLAYYYLEQYDDAEREFKLADQLDPGDEDTLEFLEWIRAKKDEAAEGEAESGSGESAPSGEGAAVEGSAPAEESAGSDAAGSEGFVSEGSVPLHESAGSVTQAAVQAQTGSSADLEEGGFWDDIAEAADKYVMAPPSDELVASVEEELVFKLPAFYVQLMKEHNGGVPRRRTFAVQNGTSAQAVEIASLLGIGRDKSYSLCGDRGSRYLMEKDGYPEFGVIICECPSEQGVVMLDYREAGNDGEPEVVHVDKTDRNKVTRLAPDFESFVRGLM
ncbi:SMI1/KNR4 family protein [Paenibacillus pinistramenti]|uniref:SMI1/KNR4 family protein n=1 Tax=Paenibacillus pinistramenti TaxID=1768003 RepID=UPI001107D604|nr:SMI1/KNR4 family protein [Paenibacillus pinistramenti]